MYRGLEDVEKDLLQSVKERLQKMKQELEKKQLLTTLKYLYTIMNNIVKNQLEKKYRNIKMSKPVETNIVKIPGVMDMLMDLGFERLENEIVFPFKANMTNLFAVAADIKNLLDELKT